MRLLGTGAGSQWEKLPLLLALSNWQPPTPLSVSRNILIRQATLDWCTHGPWSNNPDLCCSGGPASRIWLFACVAVFFPFRFGKQRVLKVLDLCLCVCLFVCLFVWHTLRKLHGVRGWFSFTIGSATIRLFLCFPCWHIDSCTTWVGGSL